MSPYRGRILARLLTGAVIAAGAITWPTLSSARSHTLTRNSYFFTFSRNLHSDRRGLHPLLHSSYPCSVFGHRPGIPYGTFCSVFSHHPCIPDIDYPIGQDLRLTIESNDEQDNGDLRSGHDDANQQLHALNTIHDVFAGLRGCWTPPSKDHGQSGTQITVRLNFNRNGGMIAEPRVTYVTPGISPDIRQVYWDAVTAALNRCAPLQFTDGLGGALAGRPFAIRFVDNRSF